MTTTITLPDHLAVQLTHQAATRNRSVEALAIEYLVTGLSDAAQLVPPPAVAPDADAELRAIVATIKATPPDPANSTPAKGQLGAVLAALEAIETAPGYDWRTEHAALVNAEMELRALDRATARAS